MKKNFVFILLGFIQCKSINTFNLKEKYYTINPETNQYFSLHFINDSIYALRNKNCITHEHFGVYKIKKKERVIVLFDDDFYVIPFDTITYNNKSRELYLKGFVFKNLPDSVEVSIPYITNNKRHYKNVRLDSMFYCKPVIFPHTRCFHN